MGEEATRDAVTDRQAAMGQQSLVMRKATPVAVPASLATPMLPSAPRPTGRRSAALSVLNGHDAGRLEVISCGTVVLGSADSADLVFDHVGVSRRHAQVDVTSEAVCISDLESTNGTFVGSDRVAHRRLAPGDCVQLGPSLQLRFSSIDEADEHLRRKLYEAAVRDPMTGLYNRRHFADRLAVEIAVAHRTNGDAALLLIDVDGLKQVNDRVGHLAGDRALCVVAATIGRAVRVEDVAARYGGDEFVVLAGRTDLPLARRLAERIRRVIDELRFSSAGGSVLITVSIGVASLGEIASRADAGAALVALADERLYIAKKGGKNRVCACRGDGRPNE